IVSFADGASATAQSDVITSAGGIDVTAVPELRMHMVTVPIEGEAAVVAALRANSSVARVEADKTRAVEAAPDDPAYADQWGLDAIAWHDAYGSVDPAGSAIVA